ncbi:MAG TPA: hypothetical protein VGM86_35530 [Thermoanaerobaculia bacterium]|jgi:hypothetical protein
MLSEILRFGSTSLFLVVVSALLFLVLAPRRRQKVYLSNEIVRRFVEYFGNVSLSDEGSASRYELPVRGQRKATSQA